MSEQKHEGNEKDIIRPYVVDGIEEYDNPMPPWWVAMFKLTVIFGFFYMIWVHWFGWNKLDDELLAEQTLYAEAQAQHTASAASSGADFAQRAADPKLIADGKDIFLANCGPCHGNSGEGIVGPNLTDNFWLHGGSPAEIVNVIAKGVPDKGMVAWANILGVTKIEAVAAYVLSLKGTNPPNAKAAQGEELKP